MLGASVGRESGVSGMGALRGSFGCGWEALRIGQEVLRRAARVAGARRCRVAAVPGVALAGGRGLRRGAQKGRGGGGEMRGWTPIGSRKRGPCATKMRG